MLKIESILNLVGKLAKLNDAYLYEIVFSRKTKSEQILRKKIVRVPSRFIGMISAEGRIR